MHIENLFRYRFSVADQQRTSGSAQGVELRSGSRWPAAFLANLRGCVGIPWIEVVRRVLGGICQKPDHVKTNCESLGRVTRAAACLAIEIDERAEAFRFT